MGKVKGGVLLKGREYVREHLDDSAWNRVLQCMSAGDREAFAAVIPVGWYDVGLYDRMNQALAKGVGGDPNDVMSAVGRYGAEQDLTTVHRLFLRLANPAYVIERSAAFWGRFQDSGTWKVTVPSEHHVHAVLTGWESRDELSCVRLGAYLCRLFQLVGAKNATLKRVACRCRGDAACVFEGAGQ